jgi:glycosyltransferase involved in cell wall biosynthesis
MSERINILYLIDHLEELGGTERHLVHLTTRLARRNYDITVIAFHLVENEMSEQMRAAGVEVLHMPVARYYTPAALRQAIRIAAIVRRKKARVVQTYHYKADTYGALISRLAGVRHLVASKRDAAEFKTPFNFWLLRRVAPLTQKYISVSDQINEMLRTKERVPPNKIVKIHNGVDSARYQVATEDVRMAAKQALGLSADNVVIGSVAWFREEKDHESLLTAFAKVLAQFPDARLLLLGGGTLIEHFRLRAQQMQIAEAVLFAGVISDVDPYLNAMDIGVLVPKSNEGFSNAIVEKMAKGLPLLVTDVGGNKEAVTDGVNGYVLKPMDVGALTARLVELVRDRDLRQRFGAASRRKAIEDFDMEVMVERHDKLYRSLFTAAP